MSPRISIIDMQIYKGNSCMYTYYVCRTTPPIDIFGIEALKAVDDCGYVAAGPYVTMTRSRLLIIFVKARAGKSRTLNFLVVGALRWLVCGGNDGGVGDAVHGAVKYAGGEHKQRHRHSPLGERWCDKYLRSVCTLQKLRVNLYCSLCRDMA